MSLPRVNSRTPLHSSHLLPSSPTSASSMLNVSQIMASLQFRKQKSRIALFALACIAFITTCLLFLQYPLTPSMSLRHPDTPAVGHLASALESMQNSRLKHGVVAGSHHRTQVKLDSAQELAAISSFIASLPQNVIPPSVDPSRPIDPQLVLDFDTRSPRASEEVDVMVDDVWLRNPVFLYSKLYSPVSREVKSILANMRLRPAPTIIDVDVRDDAEVLKPIVMRLTSASDLPVLLVGGRPVGSIEDIKALEKSGELKKLVTEAGAVVNGAKRKKHRK